MSSPLAPPVSAERHIARSPWRGGDAVTMLTIYIVLLLAIPSSVSLGPLGSYGSPSLLFGLVLLAWWLFSRLQRRSIDVAPTAQPIRLAFGAFFVVVLVSFAAALLRGQPVDQVSPAQSAVVRVLAWAGVFLIALDGVRTTYELTKLVRRLAIAGAILALLGLAQFFAHQSFLDWIAAIPGVKYDQAGLGARGAFTRAAGTAKHPLEYAVAMTAMLPFAFAAATSGGFKPSRGRPSVLWWIPPLLIMITSLVAVSRSAIIGLAVAVIGAVVAMPKKYRGIVLLLLAAAFAAVAVAVPHLLSATLYLFAGAGTDPSTQSRTGALARLPFFMSSSPFIGVGFGTFLPRYYIFDDEWALLLVETGMAGVASFAGFVAAGVWSTVRGGVLSHRPLIVELSRSFAASLLCIAVLFAFFDGLSFPQAAGLLFLVAGLCGSVLAIGRTDAALTRASRYAVLDG